MGGGAWLERHQAWLYLAATAFGALVALALPGADVLAPAINPLLGVLLFATFLGIPFDAFGRAFRDGRFLVTVLVVDFVVVPAVAFGLSRFVAADAPLVFAVLLVLLSPCVDYVVAFTAAAGGARDRMLAATPILLVAQLILLPVYLGWFLGPDAASVLPLGGLAPVFGLVVLLPLALAAAVRLLGTRLAVARAVPRAAEAVMVPLMMAVLALVVAAYLRGVVSEGARLAPVLPLYAAFAAVMACLGWAAGRLTRQPVRSRRALVFAAVTRNSLVVLPLAVAAGGASGQSALVPSAVVAQTLVELLAMVALVWLVPRTDREMAMGPSA